MTRRFHLTGAMLLAIAMAAALAACGEDAAGPREDNEERIVSLSERFSRILAAKDTEAFCSVLAPNDRQRLGEGKTDGRKECLVVWGVDRNPLFAASDPDLEIESVSFRGAYATARLANGGELGFAREGGRWYIHLAPSSKQMRGVES
jgi:hypothetical protein